MLRRELVGLPIIIELAASHPELVDRLVLVSPAGGPNNQPLARAVRQLLQVAPREPPSLLRVAMPDHLSFGPVRGLSLFRAMTWCPVVERLGEVTAPALIVEFLDDRPVGGVDIGGLRVLAGS